MTSTATKGVLPFDSGGEQTGLTDWSLVGQLEQLPKWMNLVPMVAQWLWLSLRYRSLTLPSAANPAITAGGLVGEGKLEYFAAMGPFARSMTAVTTSIVNHGPLKIGDAESAMYAAGLTYPVIFKPDIGWGGHGVRIVRDRAEAVSYLRLYPLGERILLQEFIRDEGEAGIFYIRKPGEASGRLTGILLRYFPRVIGDGVHTIDELIQADPRLKRMSNSRLGEPCCDTTQVPALGQVVRIATIGSTRVGGMYRDGTILATPALSQIIDRIAHDIPDFHVGRFDLRYASLEALRGGHGFTIVEVNGAGSEAVHAWEPTLTLRQAYSIVFEKQRQIFAIGDEMRRRGHKPMGALDLLRLFRRQEALISCYPPSN